LKNGYFLLRSDREQGGIAYEVPKILYLQINDANGRIKPIGCNKFLTMGNVINKVAFSFAVNPVRKEPFLQGGGIKAVKNRI